MKTAKVAIVLSLLFLLVGSSPVFAEDSHNGQDLSLTLSGGILDSGTQHYSHSGGVLAAAFVGGIPIDPSSAHLGYSLNAVISGFAVQGQATFTLTYLDSTGAHVQIDGSAPINDMIPAELFPFTCTPGVDCTSGIPWLFMGTAAITTQTCQGSAQSQSNGSESQNGGDNSYASSDTSD